jgi:hypothetical protein
VSQPPADPQIFHIVHADRLASIAANDLRSDALVRASTNGGTTIGMSTIKDRRLALPVGCHPGTHVGEYVPFYFCSRSIMLYVIHRANHSELTYRGGQGPIVHLQADFHEVIAWANGQGRRWAFTPSNAGARYCPSFNQVGDLAQIDWQAVDARQWAPAPTREAKQAEFLMHNSFRWHLVRRIGVQSRATYAQVAAAIAGAAHKPKVEIKPDWYY